MGTSFTDSWDRARQMFADQFEPDGNGFCYRRSQSGEAIRVSAEERGKFIDQFNRDVRRATWIIFASVALVLGSSVFLSVYSHSDLSEGAIIAGIVLAMIPYLAYYRRAWAAPSRELAGRMPVAGERSSQEVLRLRFQRITYGQLAGAGVGAFVIPFIGSSRHDIFSGWGRLWLVAGGALLLLTVIQAFRKWRIEQEDPDAFGIRASVSQDNMRPADSRTKGQLGRYLFTAGALGAFALIVVTPTGKRLMQSPAFWPIVLIGCGGWALSTVVGGFVNGKVEPFVRGFERTYQREAQPKRFWTSMGWNCLIGCICLWGAFQVYQQAAARSLQERCFNGSQASSPQSTVSACSDLLAGKVSLGGWSRADVFVDRGIAYDRLNDPRGSIADYTRALQLEPRFFEAYYDRGLAHDRLGDAQAAIADYTSAIRLQSDSDVYFARGYAYQRNGDPQRAIADLSEAIRMKPKRADAYFERALAYKRLGDTERATADFEAAFRLNPKLCDGCVHNGG